MDYVVSVNPLIGESNNEYWGDENGKEDSSYTPRPTTTTTTATTSSGIHGKEGSVGFAFALVLASAAATSLGSLLVFYPRLAQQFATAHVLGASLGFATGVMVYVSLVDIYNKSMQGFLEQGHHEDVAFLYTTLSFFGGMLAMKIIDVTIHRFANDSAFQTVEAGMDEMVARLVPGSTGGACESVTTRDSVAGDKRPDLPPPPPPPLDATMAAEMDEQSAASSLEKTQPTDHIPHPQQQQEPPQQQQQKQQQESPPQSPTTTTSISHSNNNTEPEKQSTALPAAAVASTGGATTPFLRSEFLPFPPPADSSNNSRGSNLSIPRVHQIFEMVEHGYVTNHPHSNNTTTATTPTALLRMGQTASFDGVGGGNHWQEPRYEAVPQLLPSQQQQQQRPPPDARSLGDFTQGTTPEDRKSLFTMGATTAIAIALHNFPEGLVTFVAYLEDPAVGVAMAIGIAMHNFPEGLCVSMPIYYATGKPWKAFFWGSMSGWSEPLGALVGYLILQTNFSGNTYGTLFGFVAGMMIFISIDELLPMAFKFDPSGSIFTITSIMGMLLVASSELLFKLGGR